MLQNKHSEVQKIELSSISDKKVQLFIKREDLLHPQISGNKYRKLAYNLEAAKQQQKRALLTFGGAYSNHILAVAAAGKELGFQTIGIIRGDELGKNLEETLKKNSTLQEASQNGMQFKFVSRSDYRSKNTPEFMANLEQEFGDFYLVPEGGTNDLAVKGCEEILNLKDEKFDYICVAVGTGGTISGLINTAFPHQKVLGFPALKGDFLNAEIEKYTVEKNTWELIASYHFGGYGKVNAELIEFINSFKNETSIALDPVYTGKMLYGVVDLIAQGYFPENSKILVIHTGGLQGIQGMNSILKRKKLPLIK